MKKRDETYDNISKYIILNVQFMFTLILKQRGYKVSNKIYILFDNLKSQFWNKLFFIYINSLYS